MKAILTIYGQTPCIFFSIQLSKTCLLLFDNLPDLLQEATGEIGAKCPPHSHYDNAVNAQLFAIINLELRRNNERELPRVIL